MATVPDVKGMWLRQPDSVPPDVVAYEWKCETCGTGFGPIKSTWPQVSLTGWCACGTKVEIILPPAHRDGSSDA